MPSRPKILERFAQLAEHAAKLKLTGSERQIVDRADFYTWSTSALSLLKGAFGSTSTQFESFNKELSSIQNNYVDTNRLNAFRGMFFGAKNDYEGEFVFDAERTVSAEVFGDFVAAAKQALDEGAHTVAAVLACAALEDALKRFAIHKGLNVTGKTMDEVVNALKSKGLIAGAQKSLLSAMPRLRNHAMHADWDKITPQDAGSVIGFVEQFLLVHFEGRDA